MKKINYLIAVIALAFISVSCVENSAKYKSLLAQNDSLQQQADGYQETLELLNQIENGFQLIRETEGKMKLEMSTAESGSASQKERLAKEMTMIQDILDQNREMIEKLQEELSKGNKNAAALRASVQRLEKEMAQKAELIVSLQSELAQKNIQITDLTSAVTTLNTNIDSLNTTTQQQKQVIEIQESDLNTVWYCIASEKELKKAKVVTKANIFRAKEVLKKDFDQSVFTKADLRKLPKIELNSKKAKVLSSHPEGSYTLIKGENDKITLEIKDPSKFWEISKYLVVKI